MRRAVLPVLLALLLVASPVAAVAAPVSDESYQAAVDALAASIGRSQDVQRGRVLKLSDGTVVPVDRSRPSAALVRSLSALPESHLSPYSSIKSQVGNTCWAYATVGALESSYMAQVGVGGQGSDAVDFSEAQVVYGSYNGATEDGTPGGAEKTDSDNDHFITDDEAYGFLTPSSPLIASSSLAAGRGVSYEGDVPVVGDEATFRVDETVAGAVANYSLSRLRLDSAIVLLGTFGTVDDGPAVGLAHDDAMLDAWKRAILESGAVAVVYLAPIAPDAVIEYYHPDADEAFGDAGADADVFRTYLPNYWMYDPDRADFDDVMAGHVVTLVGWDDSYSRWNFATPLVREDGTERSYDPDVATVEERDGTPYIVPRGDGAFVVKNSWGESFAYDGGVEEIGDGGTFRFSYWEATFNVGVAFDLDSAEGGSSYDIVQQYDGASPDEYLETGDVALEGANVFRAEGDQELEALGLWTYENATDVDVRVYVGLADPDDPESGTLACEQRSRLDFGYHTLELDSPVSVSGGESYSVVVSMSAELGDGETVSVLPLESSENSFFGRPVQIYSSEGESFVSRSEGGDDGVWVDTTDVTLASGARVGNLAVKAFSNPVDGGGDGGQGQGPGGGQAGGEQTGDDQADGGQDEDTPGAGGGQSEDGQASDDSQPDDSQGESGPAEEDAPAQRPAADAEPSAPSDGGPLAATSDGSLRPLPLAALGACVLACPAVLLVRRRLSSR